MKKAAAVKVAKVKGASGGWRKVLARWTLRAIIAFFALSFLMVASLRFINPFTSAFMLARRFDALVDGESKFSLQQKWVPMSSISPAMSLALMAGEDQKFPDHFGFDVQAIADAMEDRIEGKSTRGASTLTQQVAKNLFLWSGQSWVRKGLEVYFTVLLELLLPKERILELHLNIAEYGDGIYGVEMASERNFRKPASKLNAHEAAMLVAVLPNPIRRKVLSPSAAVQKRTQWIEDQAERLGPEAEALVGRGVKK